MSSAPVLLELRVDVPDKKTRVIDFYPLENRGLTSGERIAAAISGEGDASLPAEMNAEAQDARKIRDITTALNKEIESYARTISLADERRTNDSARSGSASSPETHSGDES